MLAKLLPKELRPPGRCADKSFLWLGDEAVAIDSLGGCQHAGVDLSLSRPDSSVLARY